MPGVPTLASIAIALWLGSLVHLMLSVATLFSTFPKLQSPVAIEGAPALFHVSERYHLILAGIALLTVLIWQMLAKLKVTAWIGGLLLLAAVLATMQLAIVSPRMDAARAAEERATFDRLHRVSNVQYVSQTVLVFTAALLLPLAIRRTPARPETAPGSPAA